MVDGNDGPRWKHPNAGAAPVAATVDDRWHVISVSHETRKELVKGTDQLQDIAITVALMTRESDGDMKTWDARGHWSLEDMQKRPEAQR